MQNILFERDISQLTGMLRAELDAVGTYVDALNQAESSYVRAQLTELAKSHAVRVRLLRQRLEALGAPPASSPEHERQSPRSGNGSGNGHPTRDHRVMKRVMDVEDHIQSVYRKAIDELSSATRSYLDGRILDEQRSSHLSARRLTQAVFPAASSMPW